jgi:hypothetical protein
MIDDDELVGARLRDVPGLKWSAVLGREKDILVLESGLARSMEERGWHLITQRRNKASKVVLSLFRSHGCRLFGQVT